jgi:antitoxin (DNA-binding transcriptional repressor) of toxin-antitoxin stability system
MLELREKAEEVVQAVQQGRRMILTYRGRPVMRLEPIVPRMADEGDAFYRLGELGTGRGATLSNEEIDVLVYGT